MKLIIISKINTDVILQVSDFNKIERNDILVFVQFNGMCSKLFILGVYPQIVFWARAVK